MKQDQKYSPKYWVVHDKMTDDVYMSTAHKSKKESIDLFLRKLALPCMHVDQTLEDALISFEEDDDLECILVEIKEVC